MGRISGSVACPLGLLAGRSRAPGFDAASGVLVVLVLALVVATFGSTATTVGAQTPTTSAPSTTTTTGASTTTPTTSSTQPTTPTTRPSTAPTVTPPTATGGSIGIQPPISGPGRGAEPNGPQVPVDDVQAEATDPNGEFTPVTPARILDTRDGTGGISGPFGPSRRAASRSRAPVDCRPRAWVPSC